MKEIDWSNLSFGYMKTDYNVRIYHRNGQWGELEVCSEETIPMHMAATCLHYGQEAFEGLKAFKGKDGKVRIFRLEENAARLQSTCRGILMPELSTERFREAVLKVVKLNERFVPPYESGASLYIRPLLVGTGAQVGVKPANEYLFLIFVTPVGPYFKGGFATTPYVITRKYDRAAPLGTGTFKVGGNYAASLRASKEAHEGGYSAEFYLDAKEKKYMDECGAANFFGIKNNTYITPLSTVHLYPAQHHQQEPDAAGRGHGLEGRASSHPRGRTGYVRRGGCLRYGRRHQPHPAHRRPREQPVLRHLEGRQAGRNLLQALSQATRHPVWRRA